MKINLKTIDVDKILREVAEERGLKYEVVKSIYIEHWECWKRLKKGFKQAFPYIGWVYNDRGRKASEPRKRKGYKIPIVPQVEVVKKKYRQFPKSTLRLIKSGKQGYYKALGLLKKSYKGYVGYKKALKLLNKEYKKNRKKLKEISKTYTVHKKYENKRNKTTVQCSSTNNGKVH